MPGQWNFFSKVGKRSALPFPALRGFYQLNNASTALAALDVLKRKMPVSMEAVRRGLVEVALSARFQMVPGKPALILDVAHNPHAARALAKALAALPPSPKTYAVCAMLKDKDMAGVVDALKLQVDEWLVAGIDAPRGASADDLAQVLDTANVEKVVRFPNATEALHHAYNLAGENDRIVAFGSFYTVAEVMRARGLRSV
jgi:dihydrofolate synthase/folylpolyglutamate synthase